jgi:hypothetical protein
MLRHDRIVDLRTCTGRSFRSLSVGPVGFTICVNRFSGGRFGELGEGVCHGPLGTDQEIYTPRERSMRQPAKGFALT